MPSSGIGGPCSHCHRTQSCCWRRGPASKPILCNACGSRYLVKKNLDGYVPVQQRSGASVSERPPPKPKGRSKRGAALIATKRTKQARRSLVKTLDSATWYSGSGDSDDSFEACPTDDSAAPSSSGSKFSAEAADAPHAAHAPHRGRSLLGDGARASKVVHITMEAELCEFGPAVFLQLLGRHGPSMRMKPRKPVNPRVSVVF